MGDAIDELIEEILVDAYGEFEQRSSFCQAFENGARFPFGGRVVGVDVEVTAVEFGGDERRGLAATWRRRVHYWQDLCELLVSEVHALTHQHKTLPFQRAPAGQADLIEAILVGLAEEWRAASHDYQADEALELVAWLHIAGRRYTRYVDDARRLGSDHWIPIVALAESATN